MLKLNLDKLRKYEETHSDHVEERDIERISTEKLPKKQPIQQPTPPPPPPLTHRPSEITSDIASNLHNASQKKKFIQKNRNVLAFDETDDEDLILEQVLSKIKNISKLGQNSIVLSNREITLRTYRELYVRGFYLREIEASKNTIIDYTPFGYLNKDILVRW